MSLPAEAYDPTELRDLDASIARADTNKDNEITFNTLDGIISYAIDTVDKESEDTSTPKPDEDNIFGMTPEQIDAIIQSKKITPKTFQIPSIQPRLPDYNTYLDSIDYEYIKELGELVLKNTEITEIKDEHFIINTNMHHKY